MDVTEVREGLGAAPGAGDEAVLLAVDWGSTSLRIARVGPDGATLARRGSANGLRAITGRRFAEALYEAAGDWLGSGLPIVLSGMVTSRQGWIETPYAPCPAGLVDLADRLVAHPLDGLMLHFAPGVMQGEPFADVMRGEEVQVIGCAAAASGLNVLPGTHSKWALVEEGRITRFASFLTGELYDVLRRHTLVGAAMQGEGADPAAFRRGVEEGLAEVAETGGLLRQIFGIRPLGLLGQLPPESLAAYLSGLLLGTEIAGARQSLGAASAVTLIGTSTLIDHYAEALGLAGIAVTRGPDDAAARGAFAIAKAAGLL